jgi:hypothetical protein
VRRDGVEYEVAWQLEQWKRIEEARWQAELRKVRAPSHTALRAACNAMQRQHMNCNINSLPAASPRRLISITCHRRAPAHGRATRQREGERMDQLEAAWRTKEVRPRAVWPARWRRLARQGAGCGGGVARAVSAVRRLAGRARGCGEPGRLGAPAGRAEAQPG